MIVGVHDVTQGTGQELGFGWISKGGSQSPDCRFGVRAHGSGDFQDAVQKRVVECDAMEVGEVIGPTGDGFDLVVEDNAISSCHGHYDLEPAPYGFKIMLDGAAFVSEACIREEGWAVIDLARFKIDDLSDAIDAKGSWFQPQETKAGKDGAVGSDPRP